ncbi:hypothetical protein KC930_03615 [Candidatus Saccharibacteria bacterium]|nr:hypothetical protein [Candidatus Saccharibacteria bacterium]
MKKLFKKLASLLASMTLALYASGAVMLLGNNIAHAADTGYKTPTSTGSPNDWSNGSYVYASDNHRASTDSNGDSQGYRNFNFTVRLSDRWGHCVC